MGYRKLSARPRHHGQAKGTIEDFKNVWPAPSASDFVERAFFSLLQRIRPSGTCPRPRWRYARPGPHKTHGVRAPFFKSRFPERRFDCQAISLPPPANIVNRQRVDRAPRPIAMPPRAAPLAEKFRQRAARPSTIRASLFGERDDGDIGMDPGEQPRSPSPQRRVVLRHSGRAARAPWINSLRKYLLPRLLIPISRGLPPVVHLPRNQAEPRSKIAAAANVSALPTAAINAVAFMHADPGDRRQTARILVFFGRATNSSSKAAIRRSNSAIASRMSVISTRILAGQSVRPLAFQSAQQDNARVCVCPAAQQSHAPENGTRLVDQGRALRHQAVPGPMQRLHVELRLCLHSTKRIVGRVAASAIASASRSSFFCAFTYGRTYSGDIRRTSCP